MSAAATTNPVTQTTHHHASQNSGITVNQTVPVAAVADWKREAFDKIAALGRLQPNWDGYNSNAPNRAVRQRAIEFLLRIPGEFPVPLIVAVSGGGLHFEWSAGARELDLSIEPDCKIEALRVENGMPMETDPPEDLLSFFDWLAAR